MSVHEIFPYLRVADARAAIAFYSRVFDATVRLELIDPTDGRIGHAELVLPRGQVLMLSDEYPEAGILGPREGCSAAMGIHLHVDDCDAMIAAAVEAGATVKRPPTNQFYGERSGTILDPFGHEWMLGHSVEEVSSEEMQRRWDAMARA